MEVEVKKDVYIYGTQYKKGDTLKVSESVYQKFKGFFGVKSDKKDASKRSKQD